METLKKKAVPKLETLFVSSEFKLLKVTADGAAEMPEHLATSEAIVIIQSGSAHVFIDGKDHFIKTGENFLIPSNKKHSLATDEAFQALVVLGKEGIIKFH